MHHPLFNGEYYKAKYNLYGYTKKQLAYHYYFYGFKAGYDPSKDFSTHLYLNNNPDVASAGINPLSHYLTFGINEKRAIAPAEPYHNKKPTKAVKPDDSVWSTFKARCSEDAVIDVIIPVYGQANETLACIYSILCSLNHTPYEIVVIDDCGPDTELSNTLIKLAERKLITLLKNEKNLGFVASVNRGMRHNLNRHVILLNSDTCVYSDWVDRIYAHYLTNEKIGTITPLSNSATICCYPNFCEDYDYAYDIPDAEIDQLCAKANTGYIEVPTAVGFCMFIARECLNRVGYFDVKSFGTGYGEENDFCCRAARQDWLNVAIGNVFVRHYGGSSFGASKMARITKAMQVLNALHPDYELKVKNFVASDPMREFRFNIDCARMLKHTSKTTFNVLLISLSLGGGTETHVNQLHNALSDAGHGVILLKSKNNKLWHTHRENHEIHEDLLFVDLCNHNELFRLVSFLNISHIHVHHTIDLPISFAETLNNVCNMARIAYDVTLHDYYSICPRVNLINPDGKYCGEPDTDACNSCAQSSNKMPSGYNINKWRKGNYNFLRSARKVIVPNIDVSYRLSKYFNDVTYLIRPHYIEKICNTSKLTNAIQPRTIVIIGAIAEHKGLLVLLDLLEVAQSDNSMRFIIVGHTSCDDKFSRFENVTITGKYLERDIDGILSKIKPDAALFLSSIPETFSYTLSIAISRSIHPLIIDIGAPAERLKKLEIGTIIPYQHAFDANAIYEIIRNKVIYDRFSITQKLGFDSVEQYYELFNDRNI